MSDTLETIAALDRGEVRVAEKIDGEWRVNEPAIESRGWEIVASQATMFLWVVAPDGVVDRLLERGVIVAPGETFGTSGAGYIRFALVPTLDECRRAAEILQSL